MTGSLNEKYHITNKSFDIDEMQGEPEFIAKKKIVEAAKLSPNTMVIIEDVSLCFNAWKGLPGPYM
jgi:inosine triphosphate pyrophosphatase